MSGALLVALAFVVPGYAAGQEADPSGGSQSPERDGGEEEEDWIEVLPKPLQDPAHALREFFATQLPDTLEAHDLSLDYRPRFGDLHRRDFIRFPLTLRYGLTDQTDLLVGTTLYTPNPFRAGETDSAGIGLLRTGGRHHLKTPFFLFDETFVGFDVDLPFGRPPPGIADYYGRLRPFVTATRRIDRLPRTDFVLALMHDQAFDVPGRDATQDFLRTHWTEITPGLIYRPRNVAYLAEYTLRLIDEPNDYRTAHVYTAGLIWDIPQRRSQRFLPGAWRIAVAYRLTDEQGRATRHSVNARVNVRFDMRQVVSEVREARREARREWRDERW